MCQPRNGRAQKETREVDGRGRRFFRVKREINRERERESTRERHEDTGRERRREREGEEAREEGTRLMVSRKCKRSRRNASKAK